MLQKPRCYLIVVVWSLCLARDEGPHLGSHLSEQWLRMTALSHLPPSTLAIATNMNRSPLCGKLKNALNVAYEGDGISIKVNTSKQRFA
jgi:hypothetical protein